MQRRFALKGLLAGIMAPAVAKGDGVSLNSMAHPSVIDRAMDDAMHSQPDPGPPIGNKWGVFHGLTRNRIHDYQDRRMEMMLLNGIPPRYASNRSWSPTYIAIKTAKHIRQMEKDRDGFVETIKRQVFGDD